MESTPANTPSSVAFLLIIAGVTTMILFGVHKTSRKTWSAFWFLFAWSGLISLYSASGFPDRMPMPGLPLFFIFVVAGALILVSRHGSSLTKLPTAYLVLFQGFRLPLELVLHSWSEQGTIPGTMTWSGQNVDIIAGSTCLALGLFANKSVKVAWVANVVGILCLLNVMRVVILSSPLPIAWPLEKPLLLALHFPYVLIGPLAVGAALAGHIILTKHLLKTRI